MYASCEGYGENAHLCRHARAFTARLYDKYSNLVSLPNNMTFVQKLTRDTLDINQNLTIKLIDHGSWLIHAIRTEIPQKAHNWLATHAIQLKSHAKSQSSKTTHATRTKFSRLRACTYAVYASKTKILLEKS